MRNDCTFYLRSFGDERPISKTTKRVADFSKYHVYVVPGIFGECIADRVSPYELALKNLSKLGMVTKTILVSGRSSSEANAVQISNFLKNIDKKGGDRIILVGYSKGITDILETIVRFESSGARIDAILSISGSVNGSLLADQLLRPFNKLASQIPMSGCSPGDSGAIESLKKSNRVAWMAKHELPINIRYYSLVTSPESNNVSQILKVTYKRLSRVSASNDSQVLVVDQIIPNSSLLGYVNGDHWISLPFFEKQPRVATTLVTKNEFPRSTLLESAIRLIAQDISSSFN